MRSPFLNDYFTITRKLSSLGGREVFTRRMCVCFQYFLSIIYLLYLYQSDFSASNFRTLRIGSFFLKIYTALYNLTNNFNRNGQIKFQICNPI